MAVLAGIHNGAPPNLFLLRMKNAWALGAAHWVHFQTD